MPNCSTAAAQTVESVRADLAAEVLRGGSPVVLRALGTSMLPSIWPGDFLRIESCKPEDVCKGEIICFTQAGRLVIHRVIAVHRIPAADGLGLPCEEDVLWITRGDSATCEDLPVSQGQLSGRVIAIGRNGRMVSPSRTLPALARWLGCVLERVDWLQGIVLRVRRLLQDGNVADLAVQTIDR